MIPDAFSCSLQPLFSDWVYSVSQKICTDRDCRPAPAVQTGIQQGVQRVPRAAPGGGHRGAEISEFADADKSDRRGESRFWGMAIVMKLF